MTFADPLVLIALLAIPLLIWWYSGQQRRRVAGGVGVRRAGADARRSRRAARAGAATCR